MQAIIRNALAFALFIGGWQLVVWWGDYPIFILPDPLTVAISFQRAVVDGSLWYHTQATLVALLVGLGLGLSSAVVLGYLLAKSVVLEQLLSPYIVALQAVPVVAIAPLLLIWFGAGYLSKILICALIVFFPILINTIVGIRSVDKNLYDLMRSLESNRWQIFWLLELPAALPIFLGGLKIGQSSGPWSANSSGRMPG